MDQIASFLKIPTKSKKANERGELLKYFATKIQKPIGFVAMKLTGLKVEDLYFIKSACDQEEKRGVPWSKVFYGSLKAHD